MFKTILVPVDLAEVETSRPAIDRAVALADAAGGTIRLIYVRSICRWPRWNSCPPPSTPRTRGRRGEARGGRRRRSAAGGAGLRGVRMGPSTTRS